MRIKNNRIANKVDSYLQSPLYPILVMLVVLLARLDTGFVSTVCPSPPDADSPRAVCRFSSLPGMYRPRGRVLVEPSLEPGGAPVDCRPDMALRLRPKPRGSVCDRSAGSTRCPAAYLAVVFRRYTLQRHHIQYSDVNIWTWSLTS